MKKIGENIRFYRNLRGLTQTALARQVEVAPAYISQIEANQRVPSLKVTRRIASVARMPERRNAATSAARTGP